MSPFPLPAGIQRSLGPEAGKNGHASRLISNSLLLTLCGSKTDTVHTWMIVRKDYNEKSGSRFLDGRYVCIAGAGGVVR